MHYNHQDVADLALDVISATKAIIRDQDGASHFPLRYDPNSLVDNTVIVDIASFTLRDIARLELDQPNGVSITKYAGHISYWYARLKPVGRIEYFDTQTSQYRAATEINELVATCIGAAMMEYLIIGNPALQPDVWKGCGNTACEIPLAAGGFMRGNCFVRYFDDLMRFDKRRFQRYLTHAIRTRPNDPAMFIAILDQVIMLSCSDWRAGGSPAIMPIANP
jgi:hypothetical protein